MPGTRTTQSVGPVLGSRYPVDARLVSDESNLKDRQGSFIVYNKPSGVGGASFEAVVTDADGNEHQVLVGAAAAVAHASRHTIDTPKDTTQPSTAGGTSNVITPKKKKSGNRFDTLSEAEESRRRPPSRTCTGLVSMGVRGCLRAAGARVRPTGACASVCGVAPPARQRRVMNPHTIIRV